MTRFAPQEPLIRLINVRSPVYCLQNIISVFIKKFKTRTNEVLSLICKILSTLVKDFFFETLKQRVLQFRLKDTVWKP